MRPKDDTFFDHGEKMRKFWAEFVHPEIPGGIAGLKVETSQPRVSEERDIWLARLAIHQRFGAVCAKVIIKLEPVSSFAETNTYERERI